MAKKPKGYYSPEAIIGRAQRQAEVQQAAQKDAPKTGQAQAGINPPDPNEPAYVTAAREQGAAARETGKFKLPVAPPTGAVLPSVEDWDYKTAKTDLQGKPIETHKFKGIEITPKGFDPNGNPYFGTGVQGWLKKWGYKLTDENATDEEADTAWDTFWDTASQYSQQFIQKYKESPEELIPIVQGVKLLTSGEERREVLQGGSLFIEGVKNLFEASTKSAEASPAASVLSPVLRITNAFVGMTLDIFQEVSELPEQVLGAERAARDYADKAGSVLPSINMEEDGDTRIGQYNEAVDVLMNALPPVGAYNLVRFFAAPGTAKEKAEALKTGWTEGNMLYSELVDPAIRAEYANRVRAGEDPDLLTLELQNPWAELVGELILDPLNVVGSFGRAARAGSTLAEATRVTERTGALLDPALAEKIADIAKVSTDAQASVKIEGITDDIIRIAGTEARRVDSLQSFKLSELTPAGNRFRYHREVGNFMSNAVQTIRNTGGSADDVLDYVKALIQRAGDDRDLVRASIVTLSHSPLGNLSYNQAAFETGYILKKLMGEGDSLVRSIKAVNGDWNAMRKLLDDKIVKALDFTFPSVMDLSKAADKAKELAAAGKVVDSKTAALAEKFSELAKTNPGVVKWSKVEEFLGTAIGGINGFLANNYFSLSYGYASRNLIQNMFTLWVDGGVDWKNAGLKFTKDGIKTTKLDERILKMTGGFMPVALQGKTQVKMLTEHSLAARFFEKLNKWGYSPAALGDFGEVYASKMIFAKYYQQTLNDALQLGAALPDAASWNKAGFTTEQANDFINLIKANDYDEAAAIAQFNAKYGEGTVDKWKMLDWVDPQVQKGLEQYEDTWQRIVALTNKTDAKQSDIVDFFDDLKRNIRERANATASEPVRMDQSNPVWRDVANAAEHAGKYGDKGADNKILALQVVFDRAAAELNEAFKGVVVKLKNDPNAADLADEILDFTSDVRRQQINEKARKSINESREWAWDITKKANKNHAGLWDEAILGKAPANYTKQQLLDATWANYRATRQSTWGAYFKVYADKAQELAGKTGLEAEFGKANKSLLELEQYRNYVYNDKGIFTRPPRFNPSVVGETANGNNVRTLAGAYGIASVSEKGANLDKKILSIINKYGDGQYAKLDDVPLDVAEKAIARHQGHQPKGFFDKAEGRFMPKEVTEGVPVAPPRDPNTPPVGHVNNETSQGMLDALDHVKKGMIERWGLKTAVNGDANAVKSLTANLTERMAFARSRAQIVAEKYRDFALLPYGERKNFDFALSLVYPYQFWYSRSYSNWMKRAFSTNPEIISRYANLKDALAQEQKGLPDWWKSQLNVSKLFGVETDNPIYINLEATVWPLYGLTGTDFNDPDRRTNWFTSMLDDMGKFGPSMWAPIQWAVAGAYAIGGEKDIASKWGSRAIPLTATFKAASSYFGTPIELDPIVQLFSGEGLFDFKAADPHEEGRISRALASMAAEGIPEQQLLEAARTHSGPLWEEAYIRATQQRAPGQLMSFLFGVGFKGRSAADVQTDKFYADYSRMRNLHDAGYMTDAQYAQGFNEMREKYPFMDVILLSRRAGVGRDAAYAYNVISRIPPGMSKEIYEIIGVDSETVQKFYDSGGKLEGMSEIEKESFMAAMKNAGAILTIPSNSTRKEWLAASQTKNLMEEKLTKNFGEDILDKISLYNGFDNTKDARLFLEMHPEVSAAMDARTAYIVNTPQLMKFYGGIDTLERYYMGKMYDKLEAEFGADITKIESAYFGKYNKADKRAYLHEHPELKPYWDRKTDYKEENLRQIIQFGDNLPAPDLQTTGNEPENPVQEELQQFAQPPPAPTFEEWQQVIGESMSELIQEYWYDDKALPKQVKSSLDYIAGQYGYSSGDDMLQAILMSLPQAQQP